MKEYQYYLKFTLNFCVYIFKRFGLDGCPYRAAALTFTSLLALVPLMTVSLTVLKAFPVFQAVGEQIEKVIFKNFVPTSSEVIQTYLHNFVEQSGRLSLVGLSVLLITAVLVMFTIEQSLNMIWRVKRRRKGVSAFLMYWAVLTLGPILIGVSLAVSSYLSSLPFIAGTAKTLGITDPLLAITPFIFSFVAFALIYIAVPNCVVKIRYGVYGGLFAAVLFELAKRGFALYVTHFPTYNVLYGALATIPIFLMWVYISWLIILFGAIVSHALSASYEFRVGRPLPAFLHTFRWLGYFWQAQHDGHALSMADLLKKDKCPYEIDPEVILQNLVDEKLIERTASEEYVLSHDLSKLTFVEFYYQMPWQLPAVNKEPSFQNKIDRQLHEILQKFDNCMTDKLSIPLSKIYEG